MFTQETFEYKQSRSLCQKEKADRAKEIHYNVAVNNTLAGKGRESFQGNISPDFNRKKSSLLKTEEKNS